MWCGGGGDAIVSGGGGTFLLLYASAGGSVGGDGECACRSGGSSAGSCKTAAGQMRITFLLEP